MANSDKRQAIQDALKDILKVRMANKMGMGGMQPPGGGEIDMDVDPNLNTPQPNDMDTPPMNIEINDPDGVLDQQKQNKKQQQKQSGGGGSGSGEDDEEGQNKPGSQDGGSPSGGQQQKGQKGQKGGSSSGGGDQGDDDEGQSGGQQGKQSGQGGGTGSSQGGNSGDEGEDEGGSSNGGGKQQGQQGKQSTGDSRKKGITQDDISKMNQQKGNSEKSDDYVQDWNDAIDKFDKDEVSDKDLEDALKDKSNSEATKEAIRTIQDSRERKLEIDPDSMDSRLKMPKNSEIKKFDDEDKEGPESDGEAEESDEARTQRIAKIQKDFEDQDQIDKDIRDIEADVAIKKADALRAQKEMQRKMAAKGKLLDFATFSTDLYDAIKSQIDSSPEPEDSYNRLNPSYAGTDYLMPGVDYPDRPMIPEINVYFDQSGSWGEEDIEKGIDAISTLDEFENQRRLKINLFYFAESLHDTPNPARREGGTGGFPDVLQHIKDTGVDNVIVLTDSDIEGQTNWTRLSPVEIPGCVWWLWKYGDRSRTAPRYVIGEKGNFQYNLK